MTDGGSGIRPVLDRWPRTSVAVALLGLSLIAAGCQAFRAGLAPSVPFPSTPAGACQPMLSRPASASPAASTDSHVAAEIDRPEGSAILVVSAGGTLLCFVERSSAGALGAVEAASGGRHVAGPGLTLDLGMGTPTAQVQDLLAGRVPTGTATVKVIGAAGAVDVAAVSNGYYLAWLRFPLVPVEIDAFDAAGHLLQRLADPLGLHPS